ncbi:MAG: hypothetical protein QOI74_953, partial [Micromonosporaceae bacterium]|nr:hypothetical protein [Micromonosporaceae bacterium]
TASPVARTAPSPTPTGVAGGRAATQAAPAESVTVAGRAWNDTNRNGIQDTAEPGIVGLPVAAVSTQLTAAAAEQENWAATRRRLLAALTRRSTSDPHAAAPDPSASASPDPLGDISISESTTGANGTYSLTMVPGTLIVAMGTGPLDATGDIPAVNWTATTPGAGADRTVDSDFTTVPPGLGGGDPPIAVLSDTIDTIADSTVRLDAGFVPRPGAGLPITGAGVGPILGTGAVLFTVGLGLIIATRRRTTR